MTDQPDVSIAAEPTQGLIEHRLPSSTALDGLTLTIEREGPFARLAFGEGEVDWRLADGRTGRDRCDTVEVAPNTFFIDIWLRSCDPRESLTLILDRQAGHGVRVRTRILDRRDVGQPRLGQEISPIRLPAAGSSPTGAPPAVTRELIGLRLISDYGSGNAFEHIYLNPDTVAWQCLRGEAPGSADCDRAAYWRLGPERYIFAFRERAIACASVFFLDLSKRRSTGKFLAIYPDGIHNGPLGARLTVLSRTEYPEEP